MYVCIYVCMYVGIVFVNVYGVVFVFVTANGKLFMAISIPELTNTRIQKKMQWYFVWSLPINQHPFGKFFFLLPNQRIQCICHTKSHEPRLKTNGFNAFLIRNLMNTFLGFAAFFWWWKLSHGSLIRTWHYCEYGIPIHLWTCGWETLSL